MQRIPVLALFVALAPACASTEQAVSSNPSHLAVAKSRFERIKSLEGDWTGAAPAEMKGGPMEVRYRITAGGNAVEETLMPGTDHEMVTMYYLDGDKVALTHYCVAGNQPHMLASGEVPTGGSVETIRFEFAGASNMSSPNAGHMHQMEMTIDGKDHLKSHWTFYDGGKPSHEATFDLTRKSPAKTSYFSSTFSGAF
jgi:hypothetical protein